MANRADGMIFMYTAGGGGMRNVSRADVGAPHLLALAALLIASAGVAHAQTYPGTIYVFYADGQVPDSDVIDALGPAVPFIPAIMVYEVPGLDLDYVLQWLAANSTISLDAAPLERAPDSGDFYLEYGPNPSSNYEPSMAERMYEWELLDAEVDWLNENFRLPHDVDVVANECNEINAFYHPHNHTVTICYEFVEDQYDLWYEFGDDPEYADQFAMNILTEVFYHEMGHAIVDVYNLPYTGLEENVADQFAALILSLTYDGETGHTIGQDMLYDVGNHYLWSEQRDGGPPAYWDTHGTNMQRFYNISCWAYGADPGYNQDLIDKGWLPEDRAYWCQDEYKKIDQAFSSLLAYYSNGFFD